MAKYGTVAIKATMLLHERKHVCPEKAWDEVAKKETVPFKGCARVAYLGLCSDGLVCGVQKGDYTRGKVNKKYAIDAVYKLKAEPKLTNKPENELAKELWRLVAPKGKTPNYQMEVVIALWNKGWIVLPDTSEEH